MSWTKYITSYLVNFDDQDVGHKYENVCSHAALLDKNKGKVLASTKDFKVSPQEFESIKSCIKAKSGICTVNGQKQIFINAIDTKNENLPLYMFKNADGNSVIAETKKLIIIGFCQCSTDETKVSLKMKKDGEEKVQNVGDVSHVVEKLQDSMVEKNY